MPGFPYQARPLIDDSVIADKSGMSGAYVEKVLLHLKNSGKCLTSQQAKSFIQNANFASNQADAVTGCASYITDLTTESCVSILADISMNDNKILALKALAPYLPPLNEAQKDNICDGFNFNSSKQEARAILAYK